MNKSYLIGAVGGVLSLGMLGLGYAVGTSSEGQTDAPQAVAAPQANPDKAGIEAVVRDYLLANPEILLDVQTALETKQREQQRLAQQSVIKSASGDIFNASYDGLVGNPEGNVTIVEFFDYNCTYCRHALTDMQTMVEQDPELRFVLKEFPILGPDSQKASVVSMAFRTLMPEKYGEFHRELLGGPGHADEARAIEIALKLGADEAALRKQMQDPAIPQAISATYELANKLAITGTPSYVVGDEVVFGALGQDVLEAKVKNMRTCQSATC